MNGFWIGVILSIVTGILVNELSDIAPWLAERVARQAARIRGWNCGDPEQAEVYLEEWPGEILSRPGKLTKLAVAVWYLAASFVDLPGRIRSERRSRAPRPELPDKPVDVDPRVEKLFQHYARQCRPFLLQSIVSGNMLGLAKLVPLDPPFEALNSIAAILGFLGLIVALKGVRQASTDLMQELQNLSGPSEAAPPATAVARIILERMVALVRRTYRRLRRLLRSVRLTISLALYTRNLFGTLT